MHLATNGEWTGSYNQSEIDGNNIWDNLLSGTKTNRSEMVFTSTSDGFAMQLGDIKYFYKIMMELPDTVKTVFAEDLDPSGSRISCKNPSLYADYDPTMSKIFASMISVAKRGNLSNARKTE